MTKNSYASRRVLAVGLLSFACHQEVLPMSFLNPTKTCVFSPVKARLTRDGEPLKGVTVIRRWEWHHAREDRTKTDANGEFSFPAIFESSLTRLMPIELVVAQSLYVQDGSAEEVFWINSKREPEENAEYKGRSISLMCELTQQRKVTREFGSIMSTMCVLR